MTSISLVYPIAEDPIVLRRLASFLGIRHTIIRMPIFYPIQTCEITKIDMVKLALPNSNINKNHGPAKFNKTNIRNKNAIL